MSVEIFTDARFSGTASPALNQSYPYVGDFWNDKISSFRQVSSGTAPSKPPSKPPGKPSGKPPGKPSAVSRVIGPMWATILKSYGERQPKQAAL